MTLAVIVPTFRRPVALARCLASIAAQQLAPDEVVVVTRADDPEVARIATSALPACTIVEIAAPGVLAAMAAGVRASSASIVCFTDDDAVAPPQWTARIAAVFASDPAIGGVGGRDVVIDPDGAPRTAPPARRVGTLSWYGRHTGGHHRGVGPPRDVAFLKGVNAAYRRVALALPTGLRGSGAQAHFEIAVGRYVTSHGYRLVYDPSIAVEHHPGVRQGADQRERPDPSAVRDSAYNLTVSLGRSRGLARVPYALVLGDRGVPGAARGLAAAATADRATAARVWPSLCGTVAAAATLLRGGGLCYDTFC